jgi:hypothetical protein
MEDEIEALEAIYGTNLLNGPLEITTHNGSFFLSVHLPNDYPNSIPNITIKLPLLYPKSEQLEWEKSIIEIVEGSLVQLFIPGEVMMFDYIEWLRGFLEEMPLQESLYRNDPVATISDQIHQYQYDDEGYAIIENTPIIYHQKEAVVEKRSVFIAHCAEIKTIKEYKLVRKTLLSNNKISKATHNIIAYRIVQDDGVIKQDGEDDGETAAGGRLLHLLQLMHAKNVMVVVSRWYGGVNLGPARFKFINNCARDVLVENNLVSK